MRERPVYCCRRVSTPPQLDGNIAGTAWASAEKVSRAFHLIGTPGRPAGLFPGSRGALG